MFDDVLELGRFEWGGRWGSGNHGVDCYGLAIEARRRILRGNGAKLPAYEWVYRRWNRDTAPYDIVGKLMRKYPWAVETEIPAPGDLCLIKCDRGTALGVVVNYQQSGVQDGVLFFGDSAKPQVLPNWSILGLQNFWRIDSEQE